MEHHKKQTSLEGFIKLSKSNFINDLLGAFECLNDKIRYVKYTESEQFIKGSIIFLNENRPSYELWIGLNNSESQDHIFWGLSGFHPDIYFENLSCPETLSEVIETIKDYLHCSLELKYFYRRGSLVKTSYSFSEKRLVGMSGINIISKTPIWAKLKKTKKVYGPLCQLN